MSIQADIQALNPTNAWSLDNTHDNFITGVNPTQFFSGDETFEPFPLVDGLTHSAFCPTFNSSIFFAEVNGIARGKPSILEMWFWIHLTENVNGVYTLFISGARENHFTVMLQFGNSIVAQVINSGNVNKVGEFNLSLNRTYLIRYVAKGVNNGADVRLFVDDKEQFSGDIVVPITINNFSNKDGFRLGHPKGSGALRVGDQNITINGVAGCYYSVPIVFQNLEVTDSDYINYFKKYAKATYVVTSQADLDAIANTNLPNAPLSIDIDVVGDIDLTLNGHVFNPLSTLQLRYKGTGVCTITNTNGSNAIQEKCIAPFGGSIQIIDPLEMIIEGMPTGYEYNLFLKGETPTGIGEKLLESEAHTGGNISFIFSGSVAGKEAILQIFDDSVSKEKYRTIRLQSNSFNYILNL